MTEQTSIVTTVLLRGDGLAGPRRFWSMTPDAGQSLETVAAQLSKRGSTVDPTTLARRLKTTYVEAVNDAGGDERVSFEYFLWRGGWAEVTPAVITVIPLTSLVHSDA